MFAAMVFRTLASSIALDTEAGAVTLQGIAVLLPSDAPEVVIPATVAVRLLVKGSSSWDSHMLVAGIVPLLVRGLTSSDFQAVTAAALHQLAVNSQQGRDEIIAAGCLPLLLSVLQLCRGDAAEPQRFRQIALCLEALAAGSQHNKDAILAAGSVPVLAAVVRDVENDSTTRHAAATALGRLMKGSQQAKDAIVIENIVHLLVGQWSLFPVKSHAEAAEILFCFASIPEQAQGALLRAETRLIGLLNLVDPELRASVSQALARLAWVAIGHHARLA